MEKEIIERSAYVRDCIKFHYLNKYEPQYQKANSLNEYIQECYRLTAEAAEEIFDGGIDLRDIAMKGGITVGQATVKILKERKPGIYYNPEFYSQKEKLVAHANILLISAKEIRIIRIKSATKVKEPQYIDEAGLIYHILLSYPNISTIKIILCILNKEYLREEDLDHDDLFRMQDVTINARLNQPEVKLRIKEMRDALSGNSQAKIANLKMGAQCDVPYRCVFYDYCTKNLEPKAIEKIKSLSKSQLEFLQSKGITTVAEIPYSFKLSEKQQAEVETTMKGKTHLNPIKIGEFFEHVNVLGPITFLDIETEITPIPKYFGCHPYQQIPFQYCCLFRSSLHSQFMRMEFIANSGIDPRREFIERLISDLKKTSGPIIVYFETFEKTILQQLGHVFPEYHDEIFHIISRIVDLSKPFKEKYYYHPRFESRYSLKVVYPIMYLSTGYKDLKIKDGLKASYEYSQYPLMPEHKKRNIINDLRHYCYTDVLAMVRVLDVLHEEYKKKIKSNK